MKRIKNWINEVYFIVSRLEQTAKSAVDYVDSKIDGVDSRIKAYVKSIEDSIEKASGEFSELVRSLNDDFYKIVSDIKKRCIECKERG